MTVPLNTQQVVRVEMRHDLHGNAVWNVLHLVRDDIRDAILLAGDATDFAQVWAAEMMPNMSSEVTMPTVSIQQVWPTVGVFQEVAIVNASGGLAEQPLPNQSALVLSLISPDPGRRARGRLYIGGFTELAFDGSIGRFSTAFANARAQDLIDFQDDPLVDGAGWEQIIWSTGSVVGPSPQYYAITNVIGRPIPAVIRRRRLGVGI